MEYKDADGNVLPNYKIFFVDEDYKKHIVLKFIAKDDDEAKKKLDGYGNDGKTYYYGKLHYAKYFSPSKEMKIRCTDDSISFLVDDDYKRSIFSRIFKGIGDFFSYWLWQKPVDWWYGIQDILYLLKHHEDRSNQWSLDYHLLDSIELNVPSLIKHSYALSFIDEAILQLHGNEKGFDLRKYHEEHCRGYPKEVEDLAKKVQNDEYRKLLLYVKLYKYYSGFGIVDPNDKDEVEFDKEWRHTLPVKPRTYDEFDYDELRKLAKSNWDNIWDWMKKHGEKLND